MTDRVGPTPYIDQELINERDNNPARWSSAKLQEFTLSALADWIHEPDDELEGQARAVRAVEIARERGMIPELLREVVEPRRRVCRRCEGEGVIRGAGWTQQYECGACNGTGFDR